MRLSRQFFKTSKDIGSDEVSKNAQLLIKAGFVDKNMAGVYAMLPLGLIVLNKIENIVRRNLNEIGFSEILMNSLHPKSNWEITGRWENVDILFKVKSQTKNEYALAASHEEQVTPLVKKFVNSWKDLPDYDEENRAVPLVVYQVQTKFRDELRSKSGLLRGREFRMKDAYDFHKTQESLDAYYEKVKETYHKIFAEMGLKAFAVEASGGIFTENMSHEFQAVCEAGEDVILVSESEDFAINEEILDDLKKAGKLIPNDLKKVKVAEIGNIFKLGDKYTKAFDLTYTDQNNEVKYPIMGCHGIGTTRCMAVIAEIYNDEKGLIWPENVAPFKYHLITHINPKDDAEINEKILKMAGDFYSQNVGDVLWDDRDGISVGFKLKDADLMGCPTQVVLSKRSLENGGFEIIDRRTGESKIQTSLI